MVTLIEYKTLSSPLIDDEGYDQLLAFSADTLLVIDKAKTYVIEWILIGNDDDAYVVQASDEDEFLDAIIEIKRLISSGVHPLTLFK
jgi:hypothetical protein